MLIQDVSDFYSKTLDFHVGTRPVLHVMRYFIAMKEIGLILLYSTVKQNYSAEQEDQRDLRNSFRIQCYWTHSNGPYCKKNMLTTTDLRRDQSDLRNSRIFQACRCARARAHDHRPARFSIFKMNLRANFSERRGKV